MSVILIPKQNDRKIIETIKKIRNEIKFPVSGSINIGTVFTKNIDENFDEKTKDLNNKSYFINDFTLNIGHHTFKFSRAKENSPNPFIDYVTIDFIRNYHHHYSDNMQPLDEGTYIKICK